MMLTPFHFPHVGENVLVKLTPCKKVARVAKNQTTKMFMRLCKIKIPR